MEPPVSGPLAFRMQVSSEDDSLGDDRSRSAKSRMNDIVLDRMGARLAWVGVSGVKKS